jgi:GDP-4-dehydro-6-deoxy-D-mannose reductase
MPLPTRKRGAAWCGTKMDEQRVLITGGLGFIGRFLAQNCLESGCAVLVVDQRQRQGLPSGVEFERCDVRDAARLNRRIIEFRPQRVFHLAAQNSPIVSLEYPQATLDVNVGGTICLFECLRAAETKPVVVVACSSAEYGPVAEEELPVREDHTLAPLHPYGVSKVAQDLLAAQYFANYDIPAIRVRIFNTTGPGAIGDVCSDLTRRAVEIETGQSSTVAVGNLDSRRAIGDVRDLARGLWLAAEHCVPGDVYNLGVEQTYSVAEIIEMIRMQTGLSFDVVPEAGLLRRCDEPVIVGDTAKFRKRCAWSPTIPLASTLRDMLDWWRTQLAHVRNREQGSELRRSLA